MNVWTSTSHSLTPPGPWVMMTASMNLFRQSRLGSAVLHQGVREEGVGLPHDGCPDGTAAVEVCADPEPTLWHGHKVVSEQSIN
jgi:hypothetical protein